MRYEYLPKKVKDVVDTFDDNSCDLYSECRRIVQRLNEIGWTADYYLDGALFDIKPIGMDILTT